MVKMLKNTLISLLITCFATLSAGISYALRPMSTIVDIEHRKHMLNVFLDAFINNPIFDTLYTYNLGATHKSGERARQKIRWLLVIVICLVASPLYAETITWSYKGKPVQNITEAEAKTFFKRLNEQGIVVSNVHFPQAIKTSKKRG